MISTKKIKLAIEDQNVTQKQLYWDKYRQRLIAASNSTMYIINLSIKDKDIEYVYTDKDQILKINMLYDKNQIWLVSYTSLITIDYDYIVSDNNITFPNQIEPRYYKIDQNTLLYFNDVNSIVNVFEQKKVKYDFSRNNQQSGYIKCIENDLSKKQVYIINDKEISIMDLSQSYLIIVDQIFYKENINQILYETNSEIFLLTSSQELLLLQKKQQKVTLFSVSIHINGIQQFLFTTTNPRVLYTTDILSSFAIRVFDLSVSGSGLKGILRTSIQISTTERIVDFKEIPNSSDQQLVIVSENNIYLYSVTQMKALKTIALPIKLIKNSNIVFDPLYKRIYIQMKYYGSFIYNYDLTPSTIPRLNTFSLNISFDDKFIYTVTSHSANIYWRKDLKFMLNFRNFNNEQSLKKISYFGIGYFFLVEFINKLSIYEFQPFYGEPVEKGFLKQSQYNIIEYHYSKKKEDINDNNYEFTIFGITHSGLFTYSFNFDIYNQNQNNFCSQPYTLSSTQIQELQIFSKLSKYLQDQKLRLNNLFVSIQNNQEFRIPIIQSPDKILNDDNFAISLSGKNEQLVYLKNQLSVANYYQNIKLINLNFVQKQSYYEKNQINNNPSKIEFSHKIYQNLKKLELQNIKLIDCRIDAQDLQNVIISKIQIKNSQFIKDNLQVQSKIYFKNITNILIEEITIESQSFNLSEPLIEIDGVKSVRINKLKLSGNYFSGIIPVIYITLTENIQIDEIILTESAFIGSKFMKLMNIQNLEIKQFLSKQLVFQSISKIQLRSLEQNQLASNKQLPVFFDVYQANIVKISNLEMIDIKFKLTNPLFSIFSFYYIRNILTITNSKLEDIEIITKDVSQGDIFSLKGVTDMQFESFEIQNNYGISLLDLDTLELSEQASIFNLNIELKNITAIKQNINQRFVNINTQDIIIKNFTLQEIDYVDQKDMIEQLVILQIKDSILIQNSQFSKIYHIQQSVLKISQSQITNISNCTFKDIASSGSGSAINIKNSEQIIIQGNIFINNISQDNGGAILVENAQKIILNDNSFENNQSAKYSGGSIYCLESSIKELLRNKFFKNSANNGSGGALLLQGCDIQNMQNNDFSYNSAFIGGAIRYLEKKPQYFIQQSLKKIKQINNFYKNNCTSYGKDIGSYPYILDVKNNFDDDFNKGDASISDVQSGYAQNSPLYLRLIDEEMREIRFLEFSNNPIVSKDIIEEFSQYQLQASSNEIGLQGDLKQVYSQDDLAFKFNLTYSFYPGKTGSMYVRSLQKLPQFINEQQEVQLLLFTAQIKVNFRKCQIGEIIQKQIKYTLCYPCEQEFYSILDPNIDDTITCKKCPEGSNFCKGKIIKVKDGYWRSGEDSDNLIACLNELNCKPESNSSKNGCIEGHIGPLCEECDLKGQVWGKKYGKSEGSQCNDCSNFSAAANVTIFVIIFLLILFHTFMQVYKQITMSHRQILTSYLIKLGFVSVNIKQNFTQFTSQMKILLNYFQFMMIINSLNIQLPLYFSPFSIFGGDTSQQTIHRIDCLFFSSQNGLPYYILRVLWVNSHPIIFFVLIDLISQYIKKMRNQNSQQLLYTNLIIMFVYFQPGTIKVLSQAISCKSIDNKLYIISDLNKTCYSDEHMMYIYTIILPLFFFWLILIPLLLLLRMYRYRSNLKTIHIIYKYGYFYQEYRQEIFYWDIIRLYMRSITIIFINLGRLNVNLNGLVIIGLLLSYTRLQQKCKPYLQQKLNNLDKESCDVALKTIYLLFVLLYTDDGLINYICSALIVTINIMFIAKILRFMFFKPIPSDASKRNVIQNILFSLKKNVPRFFKWVQIANSNRSDVLKNWKKVREVQQSVKMNTKQIKEMQHSIIVKTFRDQTRNKQQTFNSKRDTIDTYKLGESSPVNSYRLAQTRFNERIV